MVLGEYTPEASPKTSALILILPFKEAKDKLVMTFERAYLERPMQKHSGNVSAAARGAGIDHNYLYRLLKKHCIE